MLGLLLGKQWTLLNSFYLFLDQSRYRVLNKDQWCNVLEFSRAVDTDLKNYDVDGACKIFFSTVSSAIFWSSFFLLQKIKYYNIFYFRACDARWICWMAQD